MESKPGAGKREINSDTIWDEIKDIARPEDLGRFLWKIITGEPYKGKKMTREDFIRVMNELQEMAEQEGRYAEEGTGKLIVGRFTKKDLQAEAKSIIADILHPYKRKEELITDIELLLHSANSDDELAQDLESQLSLRTPLHKIFFINQLAAHVRSIAFDAVRNKRARTARARLVRILEGIKKDLYRGTARVVEMDDFAHEYRQLKEAVENPEQLPEDGKRKRMSVLREAIKDEIQKIGITDARVQKEITDLILRKNVPRDALLEALKRIMNPRDTLKRMRIKKLAGYENHWRVQMFDKSGSEYRILYQVLEDGSRVITRAGTRESLGSYGSL